MRNRRTGAADYRAVFQGGFPGYAGKLAGRHHPARGCASKNPPKMLWWQLTGKTRRTKALLGIVNNDDLVAILGTAVAAHTLVATMRCLRSYADEEMRKTLTPEMAVEQSLSAPPVVSSC